MNKKIIYGIVAIIIIILAIFIGIELNKENRIKEENKKRLEEIQRTTTYEYKLEDSKTFNDNGIIRRFNVVKIGDNLKEGIYEIKAADYNKKTSFLIIISDIYQENPNLLPTAYDDIVTDSHSYTTKELKNGQYIYMIETDVNDNGTIKLRKK